MREPFEVAGVGRIAIIADPTGAALGIMAPASPLPG
jgi:predicted enzyme related to lactoylglutathione lyase